MKRRKGNLYNAKGLLSRNLMRVARVGVECFSIYNKGQRKDTKKLRKGEGNNKLQESDQTYRGKFKVLTRFNSESS